MCVSICGSNIGTIAGKKGIERISMLETELLAQVLLKMNKMEILGDSSFTGCCLFFAVLSWYVERMMGHVFILNCILGKRKMESVCCCMVRVR